MDWEVVSDNKLVSVRAQSLTEVNASGEDCRNALFFHMRKLLCFFIKNKLYTYKMIKY